MFICILKNVGLRRLTYGNPTNVEQVLCAPKGKNEFSSKEARKNRVVKFRRNMQWMGNENKDVKKIEGVTYINQSG